MNTETRMWLRAWAVILLLLLAIPTLLYTGFLLYSLWGYKEVRWQLYYVTALEDTLTCWRGVGLFLAGFVTLGYTWCLFDRWADPYFFRLRVKYAAMPENDVPNP